MADHKCRLCFSKEFSLFHRHNCICYTCESYLNWHYALHSFPNANYMALWKTTVPGKTEIKKKEAPVPQTHFFIERCYIKHQNLKVLARLLYTLYCYLTTSHKPLLFIKAFSQSSLSKCFHKDCLHYTE